MEVGADTVTVKMDVTNVRMDGVMIIKRARPAIQCVGYAMAYPQLLAGNATLLSTY